MESLPLNGGPTLLPAAPGILTIGPFPPPEPLGRLAGTTETSPFFLQPVRSGGQRGSRLYKKKHKCPTRKRDFVILSHIDPGTSQSHPPRANRSADLDPNRASGQQCLDELWEELLS